MKKNMIKKTLVFYWYASREYFGDLTYPFHLACIEKYSNVFDGAIFTIAVDDEDDKELILLIEQNILNAINGNIPIIKFDVIKNDKLCEANAFSKYILNSNKKNEELELFFFGHTKGARIIHSFPDYTEDYLHWIFSLYFYSLEPGFLYEMEMKLVNGFGGNLSSFFGPICCLNGDGYGFYPGTFYWVNIKNIINDCNSGQIVMPEVSNRAFCECFPLIYKTNIGKITSHNNIIKQCDDSTYFYNHCNWDEIVAYFGESEKYLNEYNKIKERICI